MRTLTKEERQILVKKYMHSEEHLDFDDAVKKVNLFQDELKKIAINFKNKGKSNIDIETKFKQEFEKLICSLEN